MILELLLPTIIFIGTKTDLRTAPLIAQLTGAKYKTFKDRRAPRRFPRHFGQYYRALWSGRAQTYSKGFPAVYVVFGRETLPDDWGHCVTGGTVVCRAEEVEQCVQAVEETACRL